MSLSTGKLFAERKHLLVWGAALTCAVCQSQAQVQLPPAGGYTVDDVVGQFNLLAHHPDPITVHIGVGQDATQCKHYQGVVRFFDQEGTPYLIISRSGHHASCISSNDPGELVFGKMETRPTHGERMRSNILSPHASFSDTPPHNSDRVVTSIPLDGTDGWTGWLHPGGMQIVDDVLFVAMERAYPGDTETGSIMMIDIVDPANPLLIKEFFLNFRLGVLGATRDPVSGRYILAVAGGATDHFRIYETTLTDLYNPAIDLTLLDNWQVDDPDVNQATRDNWEKWQTANFIRQTDGRLFLGTLDNTSFTDGDDGANLAGLFEVVRSGNAFQFNYMSERKLKMDDPRTGNGAASGGYYTSPSGQLILYTTEHDNDGPGGSIRAGEHRSVNVSTVAGADPSSDTWIELYNDETGWSDGSPDKSFMLDKVDFGHENWYDIDTEDGWGDEPDSIRYRAPDGHQILLFKNQNLDGEILRLVGNGQVQSISRLDDYGFGDAIHSVYMGAYPYAGGAMVSTIGVSQSISTSLGYSGRLEVVTLQGVFVDPLPWSVGSGSDVLIRAQTNQETLILAP